LLDIQWWELFIVIAARQDALKIILANADDLEMRQLNQVNPLVMLLLS
jgi:hypothetical protein